MLRMDVGVADDFLYKEMAKYDFTKPFNVTVTIEEVYNNGYERHDDRLRYNQHNYVQNKNTDIDTVQMSLPTTSQIKTVIPTTHQPSKFSFANNNDTLSSNFTFGGLNDDSEANRSLNIISKNIIRILEGCYYFCCVIQKCGNDCTRVLDAKNKYINVKKHYFQSCYNIVVRVILPKNHNLDFVRAFIDKTRIMAINDEKFNCSYKQVEHIYNELIKWTIHNKNIFEVQPKNFQNISYAYTHTSNNSPQSNAQTGQIVQNDWNYNMDQRERQPDEALSQDPTTFWSCNPSQDCVNISNQPSFVNTRNDNDNLQQMGIRNQYSTDLVTTPKQTTDFMPSCTSLQDESYTQQIHRRARSTDSGFMSPDNDYIIDLCNEQQTSQDPVVPNTTHVAFINTYMAPAVVPTCRLCGGNATVTCIGCMSSFYCSPGCQAIHWNKHKDECGTR